MLKLFAFRPLDVQDAEGVAIRQRETLDWGYVERKLAPLAEIKDDPGIMRALSRLRGL